MRLALIALALMLAAPFRAAAAPPAGAAALPSAAASTIRVAIVIDAPSTELRGVDIDIVELGACVECGRHRWRSDTVRAVATARGIEIAGRRGIGFRLRSGRPIALNGRDYGGDLELLRNGDGIVVVNELPLEDYLGGVVRAETPERWPAEALRAQAIVARTYAVYQRLLNAGKPYHIVASNLNQQFKGQVPPSSAAWEAVRETTGVVLRWEGELFPAFYHAESGGYTEDPRTVFAARNMPALKPVRCPFSVGSPHYYWSLDLRLADLSDILRRNGVGVGMVRAIEISDRTPSLRAAAVTVRGSSGSAQLKGNDLRRMIGYDTLKSTLFAVAIDGEVAHFAGRGYGHGAGLCQWGARAMAEQGYQARQILEFYYRGATLGWIDER